MSPSAARRPVWWTQVLVVAGFAWAYDEVRTLHGDVAAAGLRHGEEMLRLDRALHLFFAAPFNHWLSHHATVAAAFAGYYLVMHLGATSLVLLVLWVHGDRYRHHRDALLITSLLALAVYWVYPVAPPRLLPGFVDVVQAHFPVAYQLESSKGNLYAAMPSLHMAWALWSAVAVWSVSRRLSVRTAAVVHPAVTAATVLATANHYTVDLITGGAVTVLAYGGLAVAQSQLDQRRVAKQQPLAADVAAEVDLRLGRLGEAAHRHHPAEPERVVRHPVAGRQRRNRPQPRPRDPAATDRAVGHDLRRGRFGHAGPFDEVSRDVVEET